MEADVAEAQPLAQRPPVAPKVVRLHRRAGCRREHEAALNPGQPSGGALLRLGVPVLGQRVGALSNERNRPPRGARLGCDRPQLPTDPLQRPPDPEDAGVQVDVLHRSPSSSPWRRARNSANTYRAWKRSPREADSRVETTDFLWAGDDELDDLVAPVYAVRLRDALRYDGHPAIRTHDGVRVVA